MVVLSSPGVKLEPPPHLVVVALDEGQQVIAEHLDVGRRGGKLMMMMLFETKWLRMKATVRIFKGVDGTSTFNTRGQQP